MNWENIIKYGELQQDTTQRKYGGSNAQPIRTKKKVFRDGGDEKVVYYLLDNFDLEELVIESEIMADGRKEITFKRLDTDEGGREKGE